MAQKDVRYIQVNKVGFYKIEATKNNIVVGMQEAPGGYILAMLEYLTRIGKFNAIYTLGGYTSREWKPVNEDANEKESTLTFVVLSDFMTIEAVMQEMLTANLVSNYTINSEDHYNSLPYGR